MAKFNFYPLDAARSLDPSANSFNPNQPLNDVNGVAEQIIEDNNKLVGNGVDAVAALLRSDDPTGFDELLPKDENVLLGFRLDVGTNAPPATQGILMWGDYDVITGFTGIRISVTSAFELVVELVQGIAGSVATVSAMDLATLNNGGIVDLIIYFEFPPSGTDLLNVYTFDPFRREITDLTVSPDLSVSGITDLGSILPANVAQLALGAWFDTDGIYTNQMSTDFAISRLNVAQFADSEPDSITGVVDALIDSSMTLSAGVLEEAGLLADSLFAISSNPTDGGYLIPPADDPKHRTHLTTDRGPLRG